MESLEGVVANLGTVSPPQKHAPTEMDVTLGRLQRAGEVCLPTARAYRDHCAKAAWTATFVSLQRGGCEHVDVLGARSVPVASTTEVVVGQR